MALPLALADTYKVFNAVLAFADLGINSMTEFAPIRASDNVVEVAEAVKVMSPVLLILPSITLLIVMAHCLA